MKQKISITLGSIFLLMACGGSDPSGSGVPGIAKNILEKAEGQLCAQGEKLREVSDGTQGTFNSLYHRSKIFAFSKPNDSSHCLVQGSINDTFQRNGQSMWFTLNPNTENNCLENNSVWEVTGSHLSGREQFFYLRNVATPSSRVMQMSAPQDLQASYVRDRVGLKVLDCE